MASAKRADIPGAVGVPIGGLAVLLAFIPIVGLQLFWVPGITALALAVVGVWRGRGARGSRRLSFVALGLALGSFVVVSGWLIVGLLIRTLADHCSPCS